VADELLGYYERELEFLRQLGVEFAKKHGEIARRLSLEPDRCEDPHVERLLEGFAFLAARVHKKLDDDLPEITESLLNVIYPHYVRPVPSMSVVELHADPEQGKLSTGLKVAKGATLYSRPVQGVACKFRTCYETTVWPVGVNSAQWAAPERLHPPIKASQAAAACRVELQCAPDVRFESLELKTLRFYLSGQGALVYTLYELLFNNLIGIQVRSPGKGAAAKSITLSPSLLRPLGFSEEEALLPYPRRSFSGYRLLQEYFVFPEKFLFIELGGLDQLKAAGFTDTAEIIFLFSPFERADREQILELGVTNKTFRLNCAPVINLFPQTAEPIRLDETRAEYQVVPDARRRRAMEVFSVDQVLSSSAASEDITYFEPYYSIRHARKGEGKGAFWHAERRPSDFDTGSETMISFLDLTGRQVRPEIETVTVRCTCTNRDLPAQVQVGSETGDFELEGSSVIKRVVALHKFTPSYRPRTRKELLWRLISHLSLSYLSLVEEGKDALQEILRLYNFGESSYVDRQIDSLARLTSHKHFARVISEHGIHFVRGTKVEIELDEDVFGGGGVFLFAQVLECFLGLYVSMNSFSQLEARTKQRKEVLKLWPPRAGHQILL
jgi:type VI secretion system protein ImpG